METCYKLFRREVLEKITIQENRFGFEPQPVKTFAFTKCQFPITGELMPKEKNRVAGRAQCAAVQLKYNFFS